MSRRILLCVLDWGLGHATRSLALARALESANVEVAIASSGRALDLLRLEMPAARFYDLPSYNIQYATERSFVWTIIFQLRKITNAVRLEHESLKRIMEADKFDAI